MATVPIIKKYKIVSDEGRGITQQKGKLTFAQTNQKLIDDQDFNTSELSRTNRVIADRKAAGEDTSAQESYLKRITSSTITPTVPVIPTQPTVQPTADTQTSLRDDIATKQKEAAMGRFRTAFDATKGRLAQEGENLVTDTRGQIGQARVQDTMARSATDNRQAQLGLGASGTSAQSNIAQNVISQGAESSINQQSSALRADIDRRLTEAQSLRDQGVATAESEADILRMTNQINALDKLDADNQAKEAQNKSDFLTTIGQFANDYMAQYNKVMNDNDTSNDWQGDFLLAARQNKVATGDEDTYALALKRWNAGLELSPEEMAALRVNTSTKPKTSSGGRTSTPTVGDSGLSLKETTLATELRSALTRGRMEGSQALQYLSDNYDTLSDRFGDKVVNAIADEVNADLQGSKVITPRIEPTKADIITGLEEDTRIDELLNPDQSVEPIGVNDYKTDPNYSSDYAQIIDATDEGKLQAYNKLKSNAEFMIGKYGVAGFNALLKATGQEE